MSGNVGKCRELSNIPNTPSIVVLLNYIICNFSSAQPSTSKHLTTSKQRKNQQKEKPLTFKQFLSRKRKLILEGIELDNDIKRERLISLRRDNEKEDSAQFESFKRAKREEAVTSYFEAKKRSVEKQEDNDIVENYVVDEGYFSFFLIIHLFL